ncbi:M14 family metallopeptidase [Winogradskyella alexanderae]|uniref:M14 family metallopeptidase n=1 Tax=Winogradskyella alexanderae TaxID=2877123 RepID=A0ABS7XRP0_9FLAO|nr:M14 metallopeptidase family protein [Winogradskyella alexanderae]MCA0132678.1 M14 family metallopeptidase [Winogradskyella alexanderae]
MKIKKYLNLFDRVKESSLQGRYITNKSIEKCLKKFSKAEISTIGFSVEKQPIYLVKYGSGAKRVLMWSQMHGNESTTTKALFDTFNFLESDLDESIKIKETCTLFFIPILNPDGAERYTRLNKNLVDLNRDAQDLSQPESRVLRKVFENLKPHFCFNLHGQRTIFGAGNANKPASMSFLSPSQDKDRSISSNRNIAMSIIIGINNVLQAIIPNQIGRYDDSFNLNCVGDTFQSLGVPTILFEAGHIQADYEREEIRKIVFAALIEGLYQIIGEKFNRDYKTYFKIPENKKTFFDVIIRNFNFERVEEENLDMGIQFEERLFNGQIIFIPIIKSISKLDRQYGHREINAKGNILKTGNNLPLEVGNEIDFVLIKNEKIALKP